MFNNQQNTFVGSRNLCSRILLIIIIIASFVIVLTLLLLNFIFFLSFTSSQEGAECHLRREKPDIAHLGTRLGYLQGMQSRTLKQKVDKFWKKIRNHKCLSKVNLLLQILSLYKCRKLSLLPQRAMLGFSIHR